MKEIHQEYTELCRCFTIEVWCGFRGGFSLTVFISTSQARVLACEVVFIFVRRTIISERLYFGFVKFYIYIRLWLIVVYIKILFVYMYWSCHIFACSLYFQEGSNVGCFEVTHEDVTHSLGLVFLR